MNTAIVNIHTAISGVSQLRFLVATFSSKLTLENLFCFVWIYRGQSRRDTSHLFCFFVIFRVYQVLVVRREIKAKLVKG